MITQSDVDKGVAEIRSVISADGGDVALESADLESGTIDLRLILESAHCQECVLPRRFLERVATDLFAKATSARATISIDDPREKPGYVPAEH